jgi:methylmalonyl-CoA mutase N-terminal domain/subunit
MTKLKSPGSASASASHGKTAADSELIETIEAQSAELRLLRKEVAEWRKKYEQGDLRDIGFNNSEKEVKPIYTPLDAAETSANALGMPGIYPYTRGAHATGYRGRLWTMRQFAGFGSARDTNQRYKFLLEHGQTGLSVAFDFPTLMGYDSDHPRSEGEVGKCGVAISSLADMETLFDGIPSTRSRHRHHQRSGRHSIAYIAAGRRGVDIKELRGTIQNDILKEYMAGTRGSILSSQRSDLSWTASEWSAEHVPGGIRFPSAATTLERRRYGGAGARLYACRWIHIRREGNCAGLNVDTFAPRLSFFWTSTTISSRRSPPRAARRIWARHMRDRYGAIRALS